MSASALTAFVAALLTAAPSPTPAAPTAPTVPVPTVLGTLQDRRIDEASGIAVGIASPGVVYVQNDSADSSRFFAVDPVTGRTVAVCDVPDAANHDWEDIATARDAAGVASIYLGDIGDNESQRSRIEIYRVDEPRLSPASPPPHGALRTARPDEWVLHYPDGAHNAESLAVAPGGAMYVITKSPDGHSGVYAVPPQPDPGRSQPLLPVSGIRIPDAGTAVPGVDDPALEATGAAFSRDGSVFVLRTYVAAYLWHVPGGRLAAALRTAPTRLGLPFQPQGEGITFDAAGDALLIDSEGVHTPILRVALPAAFAARPVPTHAPSGTGQSRSGTGQSPDATATAASQGTHKPGWVVRAAVVAALAVAVVALGVGRRRRRRTRPRPGRRRDGPDDGPGDGSPGPADPQDTGGSS